MKFNKRVLIITAAAVAVAAVVAAVIWIVPAVKPVSNEPEVTLATSNPASQYTGSTGIDEDKGAEIADDSKPKEKSSLAGPPKESENSKEQNEKPGQQASAAGLTKEQAVSLYKDKFFKDMPSLQFPDNAEFEEIDENTFMDTIDKNTTVSICYILPGGFVSEKSGEYELDGYVLNVDNWSTPSATGLYAILDGSEIYTIDDAIYSRKYRIYMQELYPKLPQRYRDLKYIKLTSSQEEELRQIARKLVENNVEAYTKIFVVDALPPDVHGPISINENAIYPVRSDKFKTMADLDSFVRGTYIKRTAERLLNNPNGWGPMYVEKDGRLCIDESKVGGIGYYRDWRDCKITLSEITENSATLTVTVKEDGFDIEPDHPVDVVFKMIKQGERWLLADMKH